MYFDDWKGPSIFWVIKNPNMSFLEKGENAAAEVAEEKGPWASSLVSWELHGRGRQEIPLKDTAFTN